ncbi:MAG: anti-sigma factor family protein, partial [Anaerolineae bacterium]
MSMDYQRLMQEQLDGQLDPQTEQALLEHLQKDNEAAEEQAKLESLHMTLATAPSMRAPSRLAATIMARLAKTVEAQAKLQPLPQEVEMALMLTVSLVQMIMMPLMLAASYMVLNTQYSPKLLTHLMERAIALIVMMIEGLVI